MRKIIWLLIVVNSIVLSQPQVNGSVIVPVEIVNEYSDNRPAANYRLNAEDVGIVYKHGSGPDSCDFLGARDIYVWKFQNNYFMHYDGAGPKGWLSCLAISKDLLNWSSKGKIIDFGNPGSADCASASYGTVYYDGNKWHMFYLGTPNTSGSPEYVPAFPYMTMKAESESPFGPWTKRYDLTPFTIEQKTYYSSTASPGHIIKQGSEFLMFFSAGTDRPITRTIGIARTKNLNGNWVPDKKPIVPLEEQIENSSIYYEKTNKTYFLFTNHVGIKDKGEYTDAIWVYWTKDIEKWDPKNKAIVLDSLNCKWSEIIGLPSVIQVGNRLAILYDGKSDFGKSVDIKTHMERDIGLAWLNLPLIPPVQ